MLRSNDPLRKEEVRQVQKDDTSIYEYCCCDADMDVYWIASPGYTQAGSDDSSQAEYYSFWSA